MQTPDYRELLNLMGYPPIAGGSPEGDEPVEDPSATEAPADAGTDQADTAKTESPAEDRFHDLDLSRVPDDTDPREWAVQREREMQQAFTRKTQELAQERQTAEEAQQLVNALQNPATRNQALEYLGFEVEEDGEQQQLDPEEELRQKVAFLEQQHSQTLEQQQYAQAEQAELQYLGAELEVLEKKLGQEFSDEEAEIIASVALGTPDGQGRPDVSRAVELLTGVYSSRDSQKAEKAKAPRPPGGGRSTSKEIDLSTRAGREEAAAEAAEAAMSVRA